jgi:hypothetical protein
MEFLQIPRHGGALASLLHIFECIPLPCFYAERNTTAWCLLLSSVGVYFNASSVSYLSNQETMFVQNSQE